MTIVRIRGNPSDTSGDDFFYVTDAADFASRPAILGGAGVDTLVLFGGVMQANALSQVSSTEAFILAGSTQMTLLDKVSWQGIVVSSQGGLDVVDGHLLQNNALLYYANGGYDAVRGGA